MTEDDGRRPESTRAVVTPPTDAKTLVVESLRLVAIEGPDSGREFTLGPGSTRIGTHTDCEVQLTDPTVSRNHAVLERGPSGLVVKDLGSKNGTFVNSMRVRDADIATGAMLKFGSTALKLRSVQQRFKYLPSDRDHLGELVGGSPAMREMYGLVSRLAATELAVLIAGETGCGKELVARALHTEGPRAKGPFAVFDCSAIPADLVESELFGSAKGAFTGADVDRPGTFEQARGGTLFLDEIGELPLDVQPKLLRALETRKVKRLGAAAPVDVDLRVVAATHRDLEAMVTKGTFREDLYYRLAAVTVRVPPLRERAEDIPHIVKAIVEREACRRGEPVRRELTPAALETLSGAGWKGNVRQLRNAVILALELAPGDVIDVDDLYLEGPIVRAVEREPRLSGRTLEQLEKEAIRQTLDDCQWNRAQAAKVLGISYRTLFYKIDRYGLVPPGEPGS